MSDTRDKTPERPVETHIYMTLAMKRLVKKAAAKAHRSVNGQIMYYVERGVEQDAGKI
jgi:hypothetical protein